MIILFCHPRDDVCNGGHLGSLFEDTDAVLHPTIPQLFHIPPTTCQYQMVTNSSPSPPKVVQISILTRELALKNKL